MVSLFNYSLTMQEKNKIIGVLALQGAVDLHKAHIEALGATFRAVKTPAEFETVDGLILPGGESTTMLKLIEIFNLWDALADQFARKPVWGICAGSILLAQTVMNPAQKSFAALPITVCRNGYGRQIDSHYTQVNGYDVSLIRAPVFEDIGDCEILASHQGRPVWVRKGHVMASSFHPEINLDTPSPMHRTFFEML